MVSKQRDLRIGVNDYMVKPIDLEELLLRIGALLSVVDILHGEISVESALGKGSAFTVKIRRNP